MWGYDFATAPNDPHTVYVADGAFSAGAIYRSTDAGATWSPYLTGYVVRGVTVDPTSPDDVYFWLAPQPAAVLPAGEVSLKVQVHTLRLKPSAD